MACSTRQKDEIFLLGHRDPEPLLRLNQLPTVRQTLLRFQEILKIKKMFEMQHIALSTNSLKCGKNLLFQQVKPSIALKNLKEFTINGCF